MIGKTVSNRYLVQQTIGQGNFCAVYQAKDLFSPAKVALKVLKDPCGQADMALEAAALTALAHIGGVPKLLDSGTFEHQHYLVLELLDSDVYTLQRRRNPLPVDVVLSIAYAAIKILKGIHSAGYLHLDLKPDNLGVKRLSPGHQVYLLDFGLAKKYRFCGEHYCEGVAKQLSGHPVFASIPVMKCRKPSRRDDLESLMYTLAYVGNGGLPWKGERGNATREMWREMAVLKESCTPEQVCGLLPPQFASILTHVRHLSFEAKPAYSQYLREIQQAVSQSGLSPSTNWEKLLSSSGKLCFPSFASSKDITSDITPRTDTRHYAVAPSMGFLSPVLAFPSSELGFPTPHLSQSETIEQEFAGRMEKRRSTLKKKADLVVTPSLRRHIEAMRGAET